MHGLENQDIWHSKWCEYWDAMYCSVKKDEGLTGQCLFLFMFLRGEYRQCAVPSLSWSLVAVVILFCLNLVLYVLIVNVQFAIGQDRSKKEKVFENFPFHSFTPLLSACHFVDSFSLCLSSVPISLFPLLASAMPLIALYTALIIESILCRQWVLVPWALWSRIHGINAGWQASLRPRTPSPG